jgi:hypothetical protein
MTLQSTLQQQLSPTRVPLVENVSGFRPSQWPFWGIEMPDPVSRLPSGEHPISRAQAFVPSRKGPGRATYSVVPTPIAQRRSDRLRELRWLASHGPEYAGLWVALEGDHVISSSADPKAVFAAVRERRITRPFVVHLEPENALPFGGW